MAKITLRISKEDGDTFLVDDPKVPGSPPVGRGRTMMEAIGQWLHNNRERVDLDFTVDESAWSSELGRRRRELARR